VWAPPAGAITNDDPNQGGGTFFKETSFVSHFFIIFNNSKDY